MEVAGKRARDVGASPIQAIASWREPELATEGGMAELIAARQPLDRPGSRTASLASYRHSSTSFGCPVAFVSTARLGRRERTLRLSNNILLPGN